MSLYRQAGGRGPRALVAALVVGLLLGAVAGFLLGRASVEESSAGEAVADVRAELTPVAAGLELVPIEYEGAVRGGEVVAGTEYEATHGAAARAAADLEAVAEDMRVIDPDGYEAATAAIDDLEAAIDALAPQARIEALASRASARVDGLAAPQAR
jgi:hypothetical protein